MKKERIAELLARKLAGEATEEELQELNWLSSLYPDTLYYQEALEQLWHTPSIEEKDTEAAFKRHQLKYAADFESAKPRKLVKKLTLKHLLAAACLFIPLIFAILFYNGGFKISHQPDSILEVMAGKGIRKKVILPDGTQVWLNAGSKLSYDANMNEKETRLVSLTGEAYFDVTKNKLHPFIIHTEKFSIKVLGTAFNVKAYPGEKNAEAALIRGMIELTLNDRPEQKIILKPKEKFALSEKAQNPKPGPAQPEVLERKLVIETIKPVEVMNHQYLEETSWVENKLVFENESFEELIPKLERWYNVKFRIENKAVEDYHFTGAFENESIQQALKAMQLIRSFNFKITENDVIEIY